MGYKEPKVGARTSTRKLPKEILARKTDGRCNGKNRRCDAEPKTAKRQAIFPTVLQAALKMDGAKRERQITRCLFNYLSNFYLDS